MERGLENDNVLFSTEFKRKWASPVTQLVKNPPAMRETWVQSQGWDDPL